jgi:uncharacterized protein YqiB (DUF1249 family)
MGLYESNFIRLSWLAGQLASLEGEHRSSVAGDCDLLLWVKDRTPYTSTLLLTYLLPSGGSPRPYPDMRVRIYHDAHLAEALEWAVQAPARARPGVGQRELDQRWARNVMLNKWLEYCVERGHRFSSATRL